MLCVVSGLCCVWCQADLGVRDENAVGTSSIMQVKHACKGMSCAVCMQLQHWQTHAHPWHMHPSSIGKPMLHLDVCMWGQVQCGMHI